MMVAVRESGLSSLPQLQIICVGALSTRKMSPLVSRGVSSFTGRCCFATFPWALQKKRRTTGIWRGSQGVLGPWWRHLEKEGLCSGWSWSCKSPFISQPFHNVFGLSCHLTAYCQYLQTVRDPEFHLAERAQLLKWVCLSKWEHNVECWCFPWN